MKHYILIGGMSKIYIHFKTTSICVWECICVYVLCTCIHKSIFKDELGTHQIHDTDCPMGEMNGTCKMTQNLFTFILNILIF